MRRIYESGALDRDDEDPYRPNERDASVTPEAMRTVPGAMLSRALIPHWLRYRAIDVRLTIPESTYPSGRPVPFAVTMKNAMPFPISIPTTSLERWTWSVDGHRSASHVPKSAPPEGSTVLTFDRGERKRYHKVWNGMFRTSQRDWSPAEPGEYTIAACINVADPDRHGLADAATVRITASEPDSPRNDQGPMNHNG